MNATSPIRPALPRAFLAAGTLALALCAGAAAADELKFKLSGDMEVPPVATQAAGNAKITIDKDMAVSGEVVTSGIAATMAHIHRGKAGSNGPVIIPLSKSGDNLWAVPAGARLSAADYKAYMEDELYVNVHSAAHPGGEIRGQLMPRKAAMGK